MDVGTAKRIVEALADGVDPRTGEVLEPGSPLESPEVIRALHVALDGLNQQIRQQNRSASLPPNAGKAWRDEDDQELTRLFDSGRNVATIASLFQRTRGSIASRLVRLGKVPDRQSAFVANPQTTSKVQ
jgi:hypothetical protein